MRFKFGRARGLLGIGFFVIVWILVTHLGIVNTFFFPAFENTVIRLASLVFSGLILGDLSQTVLRVAAAFVIALFIGVPSGLLLGSSRKLYETFEPLIDFFRSIPATAMFPLFLLIFGISDKSKIMVAAFSSILIILFNTAYGVIHSKKIRHSASKLMGASKYQIFKYVTFWESLPNTIIGLRTAASLSLVIIIVTEMFIGTEYGLGARIIDFQYMYDIESMYAVILLTGIIGYIVNLIFIYIEKKIVHWSGK